MQPFSLPVDKGFAEKTSADTEDQASKEEKAANSFTYSQKKKMKMKEQAQPDGRNLKSERLDPAYAEGMRAEQSRNGISAKRRNEAAEAWMRKLEEGDYSGPTLDRSAISP